MQDLARCQKATSARLKLFWTNGLAWNAGCFPVAVGRQSAAEPAISDSLPTKPAQRRPTKAIARASGISAVYPLPCNSKPHRRLVPVGSTPRRFPQIIGNLPTAASVIRFQVWGSRRAEGNGTGLYRAGPAE